MVFHIVIVTTNGEYKFNRAIVENNGTTLKIIADEKITVFVLDNIVCYQYDK